MLRDQDMRNARLQDPIPEDWYIQRQWNAILKSCAALESEISLLKGPINLGQISVATALGYLDFLFPSAAWRYQSNNLKDWYSDFCNLTSFRDTFPEE